jgi:membrane protein implicated in regulation of membrane protease activity
MSFEFFQSNILLIWLVLSFAFLLLELLLPTAYFLWIGLGALFTAGFGYFWKTEETIQLLIFALVSVTLSIIGKKLYAPSSDDKGTPNLNNKEAQIVGTKFVLDSPIQNGKGRIQVGDSRWTIKGSNLPKGAIVIVKAIDGNSLIVDKVDD